MEKEFTEGDAFVAAYSEYFGVVYKEALKYSGNHHIAEEIAQDAFFTAYIQCGSESKQQIKIWMLMFARYRAMNYIRDHKREVPLAEITMSEDRYPNSLIDDSSEDQVVALLKEKCFRELGIDIFSGTVSEECEMVQSRDSCILCGYATERSRKENGHYIKCIRRHTKESKKMDDKKV